MSLNLFKTPAVFRILLATQFVCESQLRLVSIFMPRKLKLLTNSIATMIVMHVRPCQLLQKAKRFRNGVTSKMSWHLQINGSGTNLFTS